jgi:hypothetical protein
MILIERQLDPTSSPKRERIKFAWFPTKMKSADSDNFGEVIWLEKYIIKDHYNYKPEYKSLCGWKLDSIERLSSYVLTKFGESQ